MKKRTKIILSACLTLLLIIWAGGYAYVSDYYHADETAQAIMAYQTNQIQIEQDGDVVWFVPEEPTAGLIFYPGFKTAGPFGAATAPTAWRASVTALRKP